ncbi:MAG: SIR2 family protein, partial [Anaerolineae bacterium]
QWASKDGGALSALGPRLAVGGVPAVVAMQGNVTMETVKHFTPRFFEELQKEEGAWGGGQIDHAMAIARRSLRDVQRIDWWMPTLFLRLQSGRLWYTPHLAVDRDELVETWTDLVEKIREGECTPVLGPSLAENLLGSRREIAQRWAEEYRYPMSPHRRDNLPQMAQFVATERGQDEAPWKELRRYVRREILKGPGQTLSEAQKDLPLDKLISAVLQQLPEGARPMSNQVLARLPFPYYISANFNNLLADALSAVGRTPQVMICPWNEYVEELYADASFEPNPLGDEKCRLVFEPRVQGSVRHPLVYHLFGRLCAPNSLVLTEDHYFDFLIGATKNKELIPYRLVRRLTDSSLLFLGFRLNDWEFRVLFRTLESLGGRVLKEGHRHIAVQLDPDDGRIQDARHARRFLERYFGEANISIYWGSANDFLRELSERWESRDDS